MIEQLTVVVDIYYMVCPRCRLINHNKKFNKKIVYNIKSPNTEEWIYNYTCVECGLEWKLITGSSITNKKGVKDDSSMETSTSR